MRENRTCSSEGGEPGDRASLPYPRDPKVCFSNGVDKFEQTL